MTKMLIVIDGEVVEVEEINDNGFDGFLIECDNGCEYQVFRDREEAGEAVREYWEDMKANDPSEFRCLIGDERLIQWACGESDSFGISGWEDFLEVVADYPEEQWASYDGQEIEGAKFNRHFEFETGFNRDDIVLYRCN